MKFIRKNIMLIIYGILSILGVVILTNLSRDCCCGDLVNEVICPCDNFIYSFISTLFFNWIGILIYLLLFISSLIFNIISFVKNKSKFKFIKSIVLIILTIILSFLILGSFITRNNKSYPTIYKPILYLYPTEDTSITINFEHENLLFTTYPKFKDEWKVFARSNGDLDVDGKYYYALYWDEKSLSNIDFSTGFYVDGDFAIEFLEEKLAHIGLNDREKNEFIMYWLPILEKNKHNLVYFELTEEREKNNKIYIEPKPDSLLRVNMIVKKVDRKINIKEQKLEKFERVGFTAVEWGGTIID